MFPHVWHLAAARLDSDGCTRLKAAIEVAKKKERRSKEEIEKGVNIGSQR